MLNKSDLKQRVCHAIDSQRDDIISIGDTILRNPETGFNEHKTTRLVLDEFQKLGLPSQSGLAVTGVKSRLTSGRKGPTVAILGELDSLVVSEHPLADPITGAAHACGHNAQIAGLVGAARALKVSGVIDQLSGEVVFLAVPAEEFIEIEDRKARRTSGELEFLLGKSELVAKNHFDDIDMAMMIHTIADSKTRSILVDSSNGAVIKRVKFKGRAAHAGAIPQLGINALNAATIALMSIGLQRETFWEKDTIRIHPIITKGGDAVSVVPSEVCVETFIRGASTAGILDANEKVNRCLRAGAMAVGAEVEIETIPGYLPQINNPDMGSLFGENVDMLFGPGQFTTGGHRTSSTDMGDIAHLMPVIHPYVLGAKGLIHGETWQIDDSENAYVSPAKLLAMTVIDLLYDGAEQARRILNNYVAPMSKSDYLEYQRRLFSTETYLAEP